MATATADPKYDFIESLIYSNTKLYLICSSMVDQAGQLSSIYGNNIFYKMISKSTEFYLPTKEYIFRYDPEWFWNIPDRGLYKIFRAIMPKSIRNSGFYKKYITIKKKIINFISFSKCDVNASGEEMLIQDWEVLWPQAKDFLDYALEHVDLRGKPWLACPIIPVSSPTLYPVISGEMYFNLGCYCYIKTDPQYEKYHNTKILDAKCYQFGGIKMLYSTTFVDQAQFDLIYNGEQYHKIKNKYDPTESTPTLYEKTVKAV